MEARPGHHSTLDYKPLDESETAETSDVSVCLSQPLVSVRTRPQTSNLTVRRLRQLLSYDPLTGEFRWLVVAANHRPRIGQIAGCINGHGYRHIQIGRTRYDAHRLAFLYMTGKFPDLQVDHADGDRSNNRWSNLREASGSQNNANARQLRSNTSGYKGVSWLSRRKRWRSLIMVNGRQIYLGSYDCPQEAHAAYLDAAIKYFGAFARAA